MEVSKKAKGSRNGQKLWRNNNNFSGKKDKNLRGDSSAKEVKRDIGEIGWGSFFRGAKSFK